MWLLLHFYLMFWCVHRSNPSWTTSRVNQTSFGVHLQLDPHHTHHKTHTVSSSVITQSPMKSPPPPSWKRRNLGTKRNAPKSSISTSTKSSPSNARKRYCGANSNYSNTGGSRSAPVSSTRSIATAVLINNQPSANFSQVLHWYRCLSTLCETNTIEPRTVMRTRTVTSTSF